MRWFLWWLYGIRWVLFPPGRTGKNHDKLAKWLEREPK